MIVVPLLEVKDTVLVAISTLVDQWNFFSVLMELKDPKGENVFNVYRQQLVCNRCLNRKNPEKCTHNDHMVPPWKSKRQVETARLIFGDDTGALKSESLGLVDGNTGSVFSAVGIKGLRSAALYDHTQCKDSPPKFVFVACDPNAGGPDHTALVAIAYINGRMVVRVLVVVYLRKSKWWWRWWNKQHIGDRYISFTRAMHERISMRWWVVEPSLWLASHAPFAVPIHESPTGIAR